MHISSFALIFIGFHKFNFNIKFVWRTLQLKAVYFLKDIILKVYKIQKKLTTSYAQSKGKHLKA